MLCASQWEVHPTSGSASSHTDWTGTGPGPGLDLTRECRVLFLFLSERERDETFISWPRPGEKNVHGHFTRLGTGGGATLSIYEGVGNTRRACVCIVPLFKSIPLCSCIVTLFKLVAVFCGTESVLWNILHILFEWEKYFVWYTLDFVEYCYRFE